MFVLTLTCKMFSSFNENTYDALEGRFLWVNKKRRELILNTGLKRIFHGYTSTEMQIVNPADKHYLRWPNTVFKCLCLIHHYF